MEQKNELPLPDFGAAILYARMQARIPQWQLALDVQCHQAQISYWERRTEQNNHEREITIQTFSRLARALGYAPHELLELAEQLAEGTVQPAKRIPIRPRKGDEKKSRSQQNASP